MNCLRVNHDDLVPGIGRTLQQSPGGGAYREGLVEVSGDIDGAVEIHED